MNYRHLLVLSCLCAEVSCQSITRNRILKEAEPHIAFLNRIDALIEEYGSKDDSSFVALDGIFDPNFINILPLLSEDSRHFDEVSAAGRHKGIDSQKNLDSLLWLDCGKGAGQENESPRFGLADLDLYRWHFSNIAFHDGNDEGEAPDYFLSKDEYRDFIDECMKDRHRRTFAGDLVTEFMVYATNSDSITRSTSKVTKNGRTYTFKHGNIKSDLESNFNEELFLQLEENGLLLIEQF